MIPDRLGLGDRRDNLGRLQRTLCAIDHCYSLSPAVTYGAGNGSRILYVVTVPRGLPGYAEAEFVKRTAPSFVLANRRAECIASWNPFGCKHQRSKPQSAAARGRRTARLRFRPQPAARRRRR
jgi:hypothetical protein